MKKKLKELIPNLIGIGGLITTILTSMFDTQLKSAGKYLMDLDISLFSATQSIVVFTLLIHTLRNIRKEHRGIK